MLIIHNYMSIIGNYMLIIGNYMSIIHNYTYCQVIMYNYIVDYKKQLQKT
jgi:hypothetical protein